MEITRPDHLSSLSVNYRQITWQIKDNLHRRNFMLLSLKRSFWLILLLSITLLGACQQAEPADPTPTLPVQNEALSTVNQIASPAEDESPLDASPSPDGQTVYYTTNKRLYRVAAGGGESTLLAEGSPLTTPWGLAISSDGQTVYVADPGSNAIFVVPAGGGNPTILPGSEGTAPRVPEIIAENGNDQLYYSGVSGNEPAILKIAPAGGTPTVIYKGNPLVDPSGVAIASNGTIYVADRAASGNGLGSLFQIHNGVAESIASNIRAGDPLAGLTLLQDESLLLASTLDPQNGTAQVIMVNLGTMELALFNKVIGNNLGAAGLHRAHNGNFFAWAGFYKNPGDGGVYYLKP